MRGSRYSAQLLFLVLIQEIISSPPIHKTLIFALELTKTWSERSKFYLEYLQNETPTAVHVHKSLLTFDTAKKYTADVKT